jgi:hypothetical protein
LRQPVALLALSSGATAHVSQRPLPCAPREQPGLGPHSPFIVIASAGVAKWACQDARPCTGSSHVPISGGAPKSDYTSEEMAQASTESRPVARAFSGHGVSTASSSYAQTACRLNLSRSRLSVHAPPLPCSVESTKMSRPQPKALKGGRGSDVGHRLGPAQRGP